jgi:hypothetical protein
MIKLVLLAAALCLLGIDAAAQDPLKAYPDAYKLEFENDWVKVVRVHYGPKEKIGPHAHTPMASAYVYLNDGGPVIFKHIGLEYGAITRPATKAGSFRVYKGLKEIHEVENTSEAPSDFLRVEFKTQPEGEKTLRGRFFREAYSPGENYSKVQFENEQIRITRLVCAKNKMLDIIVTQGEPALVVALTPARLEVNASKKSKLNLKPGQTRWLNISRQEQLKNLGTEAAEFLRFDFKTKPVNTASEKPHSHD